MVAFKFQTPKADGPFPDPEMDELEQDTGPQVDPKVKDLMVNAALGEWVMQECETGCLVAYSEQVINALSIIECSMKVLLPHMIPPQDKK